MRQTILCKSLSADGPRRWRYAARGALLAALLVAGGCSESSLPQVTGTVTYQNKPLEYGTIDFVSTHSRRASGQIAEGKILNVTTYEPNDGLAEGDYQVAVHARDRSEEHRDKMVPPSLIPERYSDIATSDLEATIVAGKDNVLSFDLD
ncbi:hypothetical protein OAS39_01595 [Pirellulales bacterium]|nr:hypothetical protein [Pirellulales bacterium]